MRLWCFVISLVFILALPNRAHGQDMTVYKWKKRLVLLMADAPDDPLLKKQLEVFSQDSLGQEERKLVIVSNTPTAMKREFPNEWIDWDTTGSFYKQFHRKGNFEFVLVGLDGGVKHRTQKVMSLKELYRLIDSMPMRAAERRRKNN